MPQRRLRIPMFLKFLAGCLSLAAILIIGFTLVVRSETKMESRGNYLEKHFKRYLEYQAGLGQAVSSVADLVADHDGMQRALAGTAEPGVDPTAAGAALAERQFKALSGQ